jgi:hypothetical protein
MIRIHFAGWFQCRLATDPDPYDERRGVSGYVRAYVDEPDLDRILYWQKPPYSRRLAPPVGVTVRQIDINDKEIAQHPLIGARVTLLDDPKFEGRNGVIADDGNEPIYPFVLRIQKRKLVVQRSIVPSNPDSPYEEFLAAGVEGGPQVAAEIRAATGIDDLRAVWRDRLDQLRELAHSASGAVKAGLSERTEMLENWLASSQGPAGFFGVRMAYDYMLKSPAIVQGWTDPMGDAPSTSEHWQAKFWLGGWDADALCGFCVGMINLPTVKTADTLNLGFRTDDRDTLMKQ